MRSRTLVSYSRVSAIGLLAEYSLEAIPDLERLRTAEAAFGVVPYAPPIRPTATKASAQPKTPPAPLGPRATKASVQPNTLIAPLRPPVTAAFAQPAALPARQELRAVPITIGDQIRTG